MKKIVYLLLGGFSLIFGPSILGLSHEQIKKRLNSSQLEGVDGGQEKNRPYLRKMEMPSLDELLGDKIIQEINETKKSKLQEDNNLSLNVSWKRDISEQKGVDLRSRDTPVKEQFSTSDSIGRPKGISTAYAFVAAMENLIGNPTVIDLSERHLWDHYKSADLMDAIMATKSDYTTEEAYWPATSLTPKSGYMDYAHTRLRTENILGYSVSKTIESLDRGYPVVLVLSTPEDLYECKSTVVSTRSAGGGHTTTIVGYKLDVAVPGQGYFILKNSWGSQCGDRGYHYLPFSYCSAAGNYCYMVAFESVETAYATLDGNNTNVKRTSVDSPEKEGDFNDSLVGLQFQIYRKWYSPNTIVYLYLDAPQNEKDQIDTVEYRLLNSAIAPGETSSSDTDFEWSFSTKRSSYDVIYILKLKNGQQLTKKQHVEF